MDTNSFEQKVAALQAEVVRLKAEAAAKGERYGVTGRTNPQRLEEMFGIFANNPRAQSVLQSIEDEREREREEARREPAENDVA